MSRCRGSHCLKAAGTYASLDNPKYHHSKETPRLIEAQDGQIEPVYLPPYSRELNLDEQVWNHAKRPIGKLASRNKATL